MKLWLLRPRDDLSSDDNPWTPWFDKAFGLVVRAETEHEARSIAQQHGGAEKDCICTNEETGDTTTPWLDEKYSRCEELTHEGMAGLILEDIAET